MGGDAIDSRLDLLQRAAETVAQRRQQYGTAGRALRTGGPALELDHRDGGQARVVLLCLLDLKLVRLAHDPGHRDSLVDLIGYSLLLHELLGGASAQRPAEVAELAEHQERAGVADAEAPPKSADVRRSAG
jgi:hypothetical protein